MLTRIRHSYLWILIGLVLIGCRSAGSQQLADRAPTPEKEEPAAVQQVAFSEDIPQPSPPDGEEVELTQPDSVAESEELATPQPIAAPNLPMLAQSVREHFPLIQQALASRTIASGEVLAASGAFDHKLEGYSNTQPLDFYENNRQSLGLKRDTYWGGEVFAGYRIGRGAFEPWYLERETNKGGEFKAGVVVPLARDRGIDANRAELWRAQLERGRVEPEIRAMIIGSIRDATVAYWQWVAAAANYQVVDSVLQLGLDRKEYLQRQVALGEKAEIELVDNQRIIVSRSAKLTNARQKLQQSAVKLSLFLRNDLGEPVVLPLEEATVEFPDAMPASVWRDGADVALAQANRPELEELQLMRQQLSVLLRQACNETRPQFDAGVLVAQDVGEPTSSKRDKSEFELEATLAMSVPLERRKALGKARQLRGKISQLRSKLRFASDKIAVQARVAHAALLAASERVSQTTEGLDLAQQMQAAENRLYELGQSTLFNLNLREQQTAEAALARVEALLDYHIALADYAAALGFETSEQLTSGLQPEDAEIQQL